MRKCYAKLKPIYKGGKVTESPKIKQGEAFLNIMTSENKKLKKEINKLKKKLVEVEEGKNSFKNDDILKISQKLDKLIYEYMK